ncbi:hypothetical protein D7D52_30075 [Nocardia yunnanensis]|uniref:DUF732 domain-containing protein n=1 Tax=Nocardia yunnanensis TaxID=2382165 RepID=A0A386ZJC1_9NOCA|nr:hypothetical protein [Nocardia yunnanensis]AYF77363.1 hypothetical protein D7D52_30075 [Nocardia yunnanensis]
MFRNGFAATALLLATLTVTACSEGSKSAEVKATTPAQASTTAGAGSPSPAAKPTGTGDACTEVQYEIDLAHQLQQGQQPADPKAAESRLSSFRPTAPAAVITPFAQLDAIIVGHLEKRGEDQINAEAAGVLLGKLSQWKSANC